MSVSLLKQPLLHFLVLGAAIFAVDAWRAGEEEVPVAAAAVSDHIIVDRAALVDYLQYQARAFEPDLFGARFDAMSQDEQQALASEYVREEALYREALRLGMDNGDYIIRQRLVEKVEFLLENLALNSPDPSEQELQDFFQTRLEDYVVDPVYDFTHIFFDSQQGGPGQARARAEALQADSAGISPGQAAEHGDHYPFLQDYEGRSRSFVVNNFSAGFVDELDRLTPGDGRWHGPFASRYGMHLVQLRSRSESFTPTLADIRERVLQDYRYETLVQGRRQAEDRVVAEYKVTLDLE